MNQKTLRALKASIKHWEENVAAETPDSADIWSTGCPLCAKFLKEDETCTGCPVKDKTGRDMCDESPWYNMRSRYLDWKDNPSSTTAMGLWREAATAELDFLKSLLPKDAS